MNYVYITNNVVTDQAQIDPHTIFNQEYAAQFIEAPDEVTHFWKLENGKWIAPLPTDYTIINKQQAKSLLQETDWTATVDIANPQYSNPYLGNQDAFLAYRSQVRQIAVNPPTAPIDFPIQPESVWLTV